MDSSMDIDVSGFQLEVLNQNQAQVQQRQQPQSKPAPKSPWLQFIDDSLANESEDSIIEQPQYDRQLSQTILSHRPGLLHTSGNPFEVFQRTPQVHRQLAESRSSEKRSYSDFQQSQEPAEPSGDLQSRMSVHRSPISGRIIQQPGPTIIETPPHTREYRADPAAFRRRYGIRERTSLRGSTSPPPQPPAAEPLRRVRGMCTTVYTAAGAFLSSIIAWFYKPAQEAQQAQIEAVATDASGRKRRAVDVTPEETVETLPGYWPKMDETSLHAEEAVSGPQVHTPPDSRPGSSQGSIALEEQQQPAMSSPAISEEPSQDRASNTSPLAESSEAALAPQQNSVPRSTPQQNHISLPASHRQDDFKAELRRYKAEFAVQKASKQNAMTRSRTDKKSAARSESPPLTDLSSKDRNIELLVRKARHLHIPEVSPQHRLPQSVKVDQKAGKPIVVQLREKREQEQAAEAAAKEAQKAEEARLKAQVEEELRLQIEREEEEARAKAVEEAEFAAAELHQQPLVQPLPDKVSADIAHALAVKDKNASIVTTLGGYELSRASFGRLAIEGREAGSSTWLNDDLMNGFIDALVAKKKAQTGYVKRADNSPPFESFNSQWYNYYKRPGGVNNLQGWFRRKGIKGAKLLGAEKIFFTTNVGNAHWSMLIVSPPERTIQYLDSMELRKSKLTQHFCKIAREFLAMELGKLYISGEWTELENESSQQSNFNDCGVFACFNALAAARGLEYSEIHCGNAREARKMMAGLFLRHGFNEEFDLEF